MKKKKKKERKKKERRKKKKNNNTQTQTGVGKDRGRCLKATSVSLLSTFEINEDFLQTRIRVSLCSLYRQSEEKQIGPKKEKKKKRLEAGG